MFGEEDVMNDRNYTTSVRCTTENGSLIGIRAITLLDMVYENDNSVKLLKNTIK